MSEYRDIVKAAQLPQEAAAEIQGDVAEDRNEDSMDDGKSFVESTGENVQSIAVKDISGSSVTVTVNGKADVPLSDVSFGDAKTNEAFHYVTGIEGMTAEAANEILNDPALEKENFDREAVRAFRAGVRNDRLVLDRLDSDVISKEQAQSLFDKGREVTLGKANTEKAGVKVKADGKDSSDADASSQKTKKTTDKGGVRYSIKKTSKMLFSEQLELIEKGQMNGSNSLYVGNSFTQLQDAGFSNAPFAMNQSDYKKSRRASGKNKNYSSHAVPYNFFERMTYYLANATMLIDNGAKVTAVTSYAMKDTKGNDSYVILGILRDQQMESDTVNLVKSAYPLDDIANRLANAAEEGKLVVINKNKAEQMLATIGIQPAEVSRILNLAKSSLSQSNNDVNNKSTTDSDGNRLKSGKRAEKTGGVYYGYDGKTIGEHEGKLTKKQRVVVDFTKRMAKRFGATYYFYESYEDENGNRVYKDKDGNIRLAKKGFYDPSDGSIHVDLNGDNILFTVSHELVHFIRDWSPAQFRKMADLVMEGFNRQNLTAEELIEAKQMEYAEDGIELTEEQAFEEVIAATLEGIMADGKVMEFLQAAEAKDQDLGAKVKKFFQDIGRMIRATIDSYKDAVPDSAEGRLIRKLEDIYSQLQEAFAEGVMDAGENFQNAENTTGDGGVRYKAGYTDQSNSGGYDFTKPFSEQLQDYLDGFFPKDQSFIVGTTPDNLLRIGLARLPMTMDTTHVSYALNGTYLGSEERKLDHIMDKKDLENILAKISNPVAVIQDKQGWQKKPSGYSIDVLIDMEINGKKVLIPVNVNQSAYANKTEYDSNKISTVHGDTDTAQRLVNALNEHSKDNIAVFYINKEKANEFIQPTGHPISSTASKLDGFIAKVTDKGSNVKMRFASVTESRQFLDWFGNWIKYPNDTSKVVDADGRPLVMYHGTKTENGDFHIFDESQAKKKGGLGFKALGKGNYFTANKLDGTERYGSRVIAAYLDIKAPFVFDGGMSFREQVSKELGIDAESMSYDDIQTAMRNKGYDGVIQYNKTGEIQLAVTFDSNQIKSVENIGTFDGGNPDIRYAAGRKTDQAAQEMVEKEKARLREDVARLTELLKLQGMETHGTKFTASSVEAAARYLKKNAGAKGDTKALAKLLNGFYEYIATNKELTWEGVREQAKPIANWLMDHVEHTRSGYAQEILDQIHGNRIYLDESQMAEAAYRFGSYDAFRKSLMGSVIIGKGADMSLDVWWQEMSNLYPDVFDGDVAASDRQV